jgi:hypothetical protein
VSVIIATMGLVLTGCGEGSGSHAGTVAGSSSPQRSTRSSTSAAGLDSPVPNHHSRNVVRTSAASGSALKAWKSSSSPASNASADPETFRPPPIPHARRTRPASGCVNARGRPDANSPRPPTPGIQASRLTATRVRVAYAFSALPKTCRPTMVEIDVDVADDGLGAYGAVFPVKGLQNRTELRIPASMSDADILLARAITPRPAVSPSARIRMPR